MDLKVGDWYHSKRGSLCRVDEVPDTGYITVTAHYSGLKLQITKEEASHFKEAPKPCTEPGTIKIKTKKTPKIIKKHNRAYERYPHIIKDSIYTIVGNMVSTERVIYVDGRPKIEKDKVAKGATRCKINCQTPGCKNTRDIKVQDAFQVDCCQECQDIRRREKLEKFLQKVKS
jgi:hypothetical protein